MQRIINTLAAISTILALGLALYIYATDDTKLTQEKALNQLMRIAEAVSNGKIKIDSAQTASALASAAEDVVNESKASAIRMLPNNAFMWKTGSGVFDIPLNETFLLENSHGANARLATTRIRDESASIILDSNNKTLYVGQSYIFESRSEMHGCILTFVKSILTSEKEAARFELDCTK